MVNNSNFMGMYIDIVQYYYHTASSSFALEAFEVQTFLMKY